MSTSSESDYCECPSCDKFTLIDRYRCDYCDTPLCYCPYCGQAQKPCFDKCEDCHRSINFDKAVLFNRMDELMDEKLETLKKRIDETLANFDDKIALLIERLDLKEAKEKNQREILKIIHDK